VDDDDYLVPDRSCGTCTSCCRDLAITEDGIAKLPGVNCVHCIEEKGCAIYAARPNVCRDYNCLWRSVPTMDDSWRPDRSGILMVLTTQMPPGYVADYAVDLILIDPPKALANDRLAGLIGGFIESGTITYLNVLSMIGGRSYRAFLNGILGPAIAARNLAQVNAMIGACYEQLKAQPPLPATAEDMAVPGG
jgi:hypothetical protein